ncbi:MAG: hypothetical protein BM557_01185 [Flavobacterium sp. MedPE-SWcel]|uniref:hypothetical protein n=1 Tax=uncultured Flavobacterium sp. TaxID=165435 RepID=UPI00090F29D9|nr:hypothetical protein [uncultured Flavobacterium sp.]OIQ22021.1 MAG: hypothetical protein BM557_01185 [Flavobacterium sp. MedPE-SWcel]
MSKEEVQSNNFTITKSEVQCYKLRSNNSGLWANITVDSTGAIQITSDYGDWQYIWRSPGEPFKSFLISLNIEYLALNFNCNNEFKPDLTLIDMQIEILRARKCNRITNSQARFCFDRVKEIKRKNITDLDFFIGNFYNHTWFDIFSFPPIVKGIENRFQAFFDSIWTAFINELKIELENDKS